MWDLDVPPDSPPLIELSIEAAMFASLPRPSAAAGASGHSVSCSKFSGSHQCKLQKAKLFTVVDNLMCPSLWLLQCIPPSIVLIVRINTATRSC
jgi:hypothetical protein